MTTLFKACGVLMVFTAVAMMPATASAANSSTLTQPTGTTLSPSHANPITLVAKTVGPTRSTNAQGEVITQCATGEARGNLETNTHSAIEGTITSAKVFGTASDHTSPHCESVFGNTTATFGIATNGLPWCVRITNTMATDELQIRGNSCTSASRPIRVIWHTSLGFNCTYERSTPVTAVFPTHPSPAEGKAVNFEVVLLSGSSFLCPSRLFVDLTLAVYRETGDGTLDPIYIDKAP